MARFFQAPIVQPMDYGFKLPFNEIMGALSIKQKEQDTLKAELGKLQDNPLDALAADYALRGGSVTQSQRNVDAIMYDENGNVRDLTGQTRQIQAEARRQYMQKQTGGVDWGVSTSKTIHDKYLEEIAKNDKLTADQKNFYTEASQHNYAERGGLGAPQGAGGLYTEGQLFQGIKPAAYVDIPKLGEVYGDKVGQTQIQTSGATIDPTTSKVMSVDGKHFQSKDFGMIQTGTLLTTTYEQIFNATAQGIAGNEEAVQYLEHEAKAMAWKAGNKNPTPEQINEHVNKRIQEEADRAGHKFMSAKFEPKVYDNWLYQYKVKQANDIALIDYQKVQDIPLIEVPINTTQTVINPDTYTKKKPELLKTMQTNATQIASMEINGKLKPELAANAASAKQYQDLKDRQRNYEMELKGITNSENMVLGEGGFNSSNLMFTTISAVADDYGADPKFKQALAVYIATGKSNPALLSDDDKKTVENVYKALEHYTTDPKMAGYTFSADMNARAEELAAGKIPKLILDSANEATSKGGTRKPNYDYLGNHLAQTLPKKYAELREKTLLETVKKVNASGGLNYQSNYTMLDASGGETANAFTSLEETGIDALKKSDFAGLKISDGLLQGQTFSKDLLLTGYAGWIIDDSTMSLNMLPQNNGTPGFGGKAQYRISAMMVNPSTKQRKPTSQIVIIAPGKTSNLTSVREEGAMQLMNGIVDKLSETNAQKDWAMAAELVGGNTPLIEVMHDQGISHMTPGSTRNIVDNEGRPYITAYMRENGNYEFFWPEKGADGNYVFSTKDSQRIEDERANFYAKQKQASGTKLATEFKDIRDFQELIGEKVYLSKTNKKSQDLNRTIFDSRYLLR